MRSCLTKMKATSVGLALHYNIWDFQKPVEVLGVGYLWKSVLNLQLKHCWSADFSGAMQFTAAESMLSATEKPVEKLKFLL